MTTPPFHGIASPIREPLVRREVSARGLYDVDGRADRRGGGGSEMVVRIGVATTSGTTLSFRCRAGCEDVTPTPGGGRITFNDPDDLRAFVAMLVAAMQRGTADGVFARPEDASLVP